ncbi:hypothetical protein C8Q76DRAFT_796726 [Earliella scabrosa]|nr:hypothetical protein C8Q76DRAFT_796726 [Earliella scabrosa]
MNTVVRVYDNIHSELDPSYDDGEYTEPATHVSPLHPPEETDPHRSRRTHPAPATDLLGGSSTGERRPSKPPLSHFTLLIFSILSQTTSVLAQRPGQITWFNASGLGINECGSVDKNNDLAVHLSPDLWNSADCSRKISISYGGGSITAQITGKPAAGQGSKSRTTIVTSVVSAALALVIGAAGMLCWRRRRVAARRQRGREELTAQVDIGHSVMSGTSEGYSSSHLPPSSEWDAHALKLAEVASSSESTDPPAEGNPDGVRPGDSVERAGAEYETSAGEEDGRGRTNPGAQVVYEFDGGVRLAGGPPGRTGEPVDVRGLAIAHPPPYQLFD